MGAEGDLPYAGVLADPNSPDPLQALVDERPRMDVDAVLEQRPEQSRRVIELRYGLSYGVPSTADAVAAELGVARERVRQIELHSLRKLGAHVMPVPEAA